MLRIQCPPTLVPGSKVLLIGESPGREECAEGRGFVGPAGRVLQRAAKLAGLEWTSLSLSNVVKRPPDGGYSSEYFRKTFYETQETPIITKTGKVSKKVRRVTTPTTEYQSWVHQSLSTDIRGLSPNVVVAVGNEALSALTGLTEIHKWRGSVIESTLVPGQKVIPVVHPSYIMRGQWSDFWPLVYDLKKVKRQAEYPAIRREPYEAVVIQSPDELEYHLSRIRDRWSLDIETRGGSVACVGIGYQDGTTWVGTCTPIQTSKEPFFSLVGEQEIWKSLHGHFASKALLVGQNITYDLDYLKDYGLWPIGIYMDTMTAHCLLYPEWSQGYKGLDFLTSFYLDDVPYYKDEGKTWGSKTPDADLWQYNIKDVVHTLRVSYEIDKQLEQRGLMKKYQQEIIPLTVLALEMMERRLPINESNVELLGTLLGEELLQVQEQLHTRLGYEINTASPAQVKLLLYTKMRLPARHKKGKVTVEENALRELRVYYPDPVLDLIIKDRHLRKRKSSFLDVELEDEDVT